MTEVSAAAIKKTQDSLGAIIKKPVLTDKLLRKPPFKFLHDIITAVINGTGFLKGLYSEHELQSENIKDRDSKIAFLQKTIDVVKIATKQDVKARPSKIVAGLGADKTNELLQAIAKAINRKIDTTEAVTQVKSGKNAIPTEKKATKAQSKGENEQKATNKLTKQASTTKKAKGATVPDAKPKRKTDNNAKLSKQDSKESINERKPKTKPTEKKEKQHSENHAAKENGVADPAQSNKQINNVEKMNENNAEEKEVNVSLTERKKSFSKVSEQKMWRLKTISPMKLSM